MRRKRCLTWTVVPLVMLLNGCGRDKEPARAARPREAGPVTVAVVNYPLAYFAERMAGGRVNILFPVPPDVDPAFWRPTDAQVRQYQEADLVLLNGADYAKWLKTATLRPSRTVNTSAAFADTYLRFAHAVTHSHGPEGPHEHGTIDFNTWLDPHLAARQAEAVRDALVKLVPAAQADIGSRFKSLRTDLQGLGGKLDEVSKSLGDRPLLASHPVYNYLAKRFGWNLQSVHWEPGEIPPETEWQRLESLLKKHPAKIMLWEDTPDPAVADRARALGLTCVPFRPCGNRPAKGDYLSVMRENVATLRSALK